MEKLTQLFSGLGKNAEVFADEFPTMFLMGMGVVFVGLIVIVFLCMALSLISKISKKAAPAPAPAPKQEAVPPSQTVTDDREQLLAAITAVIADMTGTDDFRIVSFKKIN